MPLLYGCTKCSFQEHYKNPIIHIYQQDIANDIIYQE